MGDEANLESYSPECVEGEFSELRPNGVLGSTEIFLFSVPYQRVGFICRYGKRPLRKEATADVLHAQGPRPR
jgi:hypothetical protein